MVLMEHKIVDDTIIITKTELMIERERLIGKQTTAKAEGNHDSWVYLSGQIRTINDMLRYFDFPEGRDKSDTTGIGL